MQTKINADEIQTFLSDASFIRDGYAERVVLPESVAEVSEILAIANRERNFAQSQIVNQADRAELGELIHRGGSGAHEN